MLKYTLRDAVVIVQYNECYPQGTSLHRHLRSCTPAAPRRIARLFLFLKTEL